jgi:hypothetical protein
MGALDIRPSHSFVAELIALHALSTYNFPLLIILVTFTLLFPVFIVSHKFIIIVEFFAFGG